MNSIHSTQRTSYDEVPYESFPFPQTHPDRLATLGRLFAIQPPPLERCRVLELGCASGGNLIPMAVAMPQAELVGIDLSAIQVAQGQAIIDALGLNNIRLLAMSITEIDDCLGTFDYILSHGVYSWVPDFVQEKILAICAGQLSPNGIAYISYNTLPGWRMRGMIRDLMRYHAMQFPEPAARVAQARAILDFLAKWAPAGNNAYGILLKSELEGLRRQPDYYILHEHLEDINEPLYFHQFIERAGRHGLQYLAEADFSTMLASNFPKEVNETVWRIAPDVIRQEQFMDFLRNRTFRQTLLVRKCLAVNRSLTPDRVMPLWVSAALRPVKPLPELHTEVEEEFRAPGGGVLKTPNPVTKAAIVLLAERWPGVLAFSDLLGKSLDRLNQERWAASESDPHAETTLASDLLQCYAAGLIELHAAAAPFVTRPGERPKVSPLARWQARQSAAQVTTLRHEIISIDQNLARLLPLLDGSRGRKEINRLVMELALANPAGKGRTRKELAGPVRERVEQMLLQIAQSALLLA